jgi:hypothetical protein
MTTEWFIARGGVDGGTATSDDLRAMARRGELLPTDHLWKEGMKEWRIASDFPQLFTADLAATGTAFPEEPPAVEGIPVISINTGPGSGPQKGATPAVATFVTTATASAKKATASLKSAGNRIALKAERTKLVTVTLPSAYAVLGKAVYKDGTRRDEFADLFKATADLLARRSQIDEEAKARPMGSGLADKAKKVASDAAALARMKAIDLEAYQALARLGEAVYEKHGGDAGATDLVEPITRAITRRDQLDRDMKEMVPAAAKAAAGHQQYYGWLKFVGIAFLCLAVLGPCLGGNDTVNRPSKHAPQASGSDAALKELAAVAFSECTAGMTPDEVQAALRAAASRNRAQWGAFKKITPSKTKGTKGDYIINGFYPKMIHWYGGVSPNGDGRTPIECQYIKDELTGKWALLSAHIGDDQFQMASKPNCTTHLFEVSQKGRGFHAVIHAPNTGDPGKDSFGVTAAEILRGKLRGQYQIVDRKLIGRN